MPPLPPNKGRWRVRVIRAGLSLNRNFYSDRVLSEAVPLFDGVRVFVKSDADHLAGTGKDLRNLVDRLANPSFAAGRTPDGGEVMADLELIEPDSAIGRKLTEARRRGMSDLFGLSIDATASVREGRIDGKPARIATTIQRVKSVDLIVEPGAGGRVIDLLEAAAPQGGNAIMNRDEIITLIRATRPELLAGKDEATIGDAELASILGTAVRESAPSDGAALAAVRSRVERTSLPPVARERVIADLTREGRLTEAAAEQRIREEIAYLAPSSRGGVVSGLGDSPSFVSITEGRHDKVGKMLDALFDPKDASVTSIRECYVEITGDRRFTGRVRNCDHGRLREALESQTFADVLGDAISRRMIQDYNAASVYDVYKDLIRVVPVSDFREQQRVRWGGYGDLPVVGESEPYLELTSPTDEAAKYSVRKRGGLETITLETITNDDMGVVLDVPRRLAKAAKRGVSKFVLDFFRTNPAIYDGKALFHEDHGNLAAAALSSAAVGAGRVAMKRQTEKDSGERLGIPPRFLWVPDELEQSAFNLFRRDTNQDADFIQSLKLDVRPVWCWEDPNDWMLSADPTEVPIMELGYLNGSEEPQLFIQDSPTSGSLFTNDQVTYKVRHVFGGAILDWRGVYKSIISA